MRKHRMLNPRWQISLISPNVPAFILGLYLAIAFPWRCGAHEETKAGAGEALTLVRTGVAPWLVAESSRTNALALREGEETVIVPINVVAREQEFRRVFGTTNVPLRLVEFELSSTGARPFNWFCVESANAYPHDFRVFMTESARSYVCYSSSEGVKLFRVAENTDASVARQMLLTGAGGPGAVIPLRDAVLAEAVGADYFVGTNALHWTIVVERIADVDGDLRITVHGKRETPKFTFALRNHQWELTRREP
jgi:hypothetical protein